MESRNQRYVPGLDHVRAYAASWIVIYHAFQLVSAQLTRGKHFDPALDWVVSNNPLLSLVAEGHAAVGLFMALSGFVLARAALGHEVNYWRFIQNRLLRIYPMFLVVVFAGVALGGGTATLEGLAMTILPLGSMHGATVMQPFSNTLWAVGIEFQFYLIFPFLISFLTANGPRQLGLMILTAVLVRAMILASGGDLRYVSYATIVGRIDEFLWGMLAAYFASRYRAPAYLFPPVVLICVAALFAYNHNNGYLSSAPWKLIWPTVQGLLSSAFIVSYLSCVHLMPSFLSRVIAAVGKVSFSMYLLHFVLVSTLAGLLVPGALGPGDPYLIALCVGTFVILPATIVMSRLTYAAVEEPFLAMRVKYLLPRAVQPVDAKPGEFS